MRQWGREGQTDDQAFMDGGEERVRQTDDRDSGEERVRQMIRDSGEQKGQTDR